MQPRPDGGCTYLALFVDDDNPWTNPGGQLFFQFYHLITFSNIFFLYYEEEIPRTEIQIIIIEKCVYLVLFQQKGSIVKQVTFETTPKEFGVGK